MSNSVSYFTCCKTLVIRTHMMEVLNWGMNE